MEPKKWWFPKGISYSRVPFSKSDINFGGLLLSWKLTVRTWKWMVGILFSFWDGKISWAMSVSGKVNGSFMTHFGREWNEWNLMHMLRFWGIAPLFVDGWWKRYLTKRLDSYFDTFLKGRMVMGIGLSCVLAWPLVTKCFHDRSISVMSWSVLLNTTIHIVMRFLVT